MATHSSILALKIPWTEEPGGLKSMGLQRVRHVLVTEHAHLSCIHKYTHVYTTAYTFGSTPVTFTLLIYFSLLCSYNIFHYSIVIKCFLT